MSGNAMDYMVLEDLIEKVGAEQVREMVTEIAPPKFDWKKAAKYGSFLVTVLFWMSISPAAFEISLPPVATYAIGMSNIALLKYVWA